MTHFLCGKENEGGEHEGKSTISDELIPRWHSWLAIHSIYKYLNEMFRKLASVLLIKFWYFRDPLESFELSKIEVKKTTSSFVPSDSYLLSKHIFFASFSLYGLKECNFLWCVGKFVLWWINTHWSVFE